MAGIHTPLSLLAQQANPDANQLDAVTRVKLLTTLMAGLVIVGIVLMVLAWLGSRAVRRYMASGKPISRSELSTDPDDWSKKPLDQN